MNCNSYDHLTLDLRTLHFINHLWSVTLCCLINLWSTLPFVYWYHEHITVNYAQVHQLVRADMGFGPAWIFIFGGVVFFQQNWSKEPNFIGRISENQKWGRRDINCDGIKIKSKWQCVGSCRITVLTYFERKTSS